MTLTEQQIKIISERPLNDTLTRFQVMLRDLNSNHVWQDDIASLLATLAGSPAAFSLRSPIDASSVTARLFSFAQLVQGGRLMLEQFRPLISSVVNNSPDVDIWDAVLNLIERLGPLTARPSSIARPSIIAPTFNGTPFKLNSSRLADSETRDIIERELFEEIKQCTFRNVKGFFDKFFNPETWRRDQQAMLRAIMAAHNGKTWIEFPSTPDEKPIWNWLCSLEERFLAGAPHKLYTTRTAHQFKERKGQMDVFWQTPATNANNTFEFKDILIVGEQKKSYNTGRFKATLLQLARYVRGIFADQPTRRFIHAFSLCASTMELWVFDRSGPYSSGPFNIHHEPDKLARALVGYATMDENATGLDMFIKRENEYRHITLDDLSGNKIRVRLDKAIVRQQAIVCRGTTCYKTQNNQVAKFSWVSDKRKLEAEQLKLAEQRGVKGVARLVAFRQITTIAELREGLEFPERHLFRGETVHFEDLSSATESTKTSSYKRKSLSENTSSENTPHNTSGPKRRRSNSQKSRLATEFNDHRPGEEFNDHTPGEDLWGNRIYSCLLVSPAGRVISEFITIMELLESMRDAIKAHQSLYITGNILHRDISPNNIIITKSEEGFKGMLIDLDLAKVQDGSPSGARHQTGTIQFMAIQVLRNADHTYRHDLESFFYVLLWMCALQSWNHGFGGKEPPRDSALRGWETGTFKQIAAVKVGHMTVNGLQEVMDEFPDMFDVVKPLCLKIRSILFGETANLNIGTPSCEPDELYRSIITAYDDVIDAIMKN
ncbi:hypothetical protein ED733_008727 [Metarhizium rileyi]|uniref:EKC/KEOPS complex subunit BUD32 n=1 Tax=Metarhizium rileyi (strain RCEF 4871) TaxID=1649241 RepID=A0A5C6GQ83_METRR|nr:hypothetical protein ED733_008727 [Metarhizium rileyi]